MKAPSKRRNTTLVNTITVLVTALALVVGGHRLHEIIWGGVAGSARTTAVVEWEQLASFGHRLGPPDTKVTIVEFFDFTCPYCQEAALALAALQSRYPDDVAVVSRHALSNDATAIEAAIASECAARLGRFRSFYDALMTRGSRALIDGEDWVVWADQSGIDAVAAFADCLDSTSGFAAIERDTVAARELGVEMTPTLLVNEIMFSGYPGFDALHEAVQQAINGGGSRLRPAGGGVPRQQEHGQVERIWELDGVATEFLDSEHLGDSEVTVDATGVIYLLNETARKVYVISQQGELVDSLGRAGSGPGEFLAPDALDVSSDGVLTVFDLQAGLIRWRVPAMALLDRIRLGERIAFEGGHFRGLGQGFVVTESVYLAREDQAERYETNLIRWTSGGGVERLASGPMQVSRHMEAPDCIRGMIFPQVFQPTLAWDLRGDVLAVASDSIYLIDVFHGDERVTRIERHDVQRRRVTRSMAEREEDEELVWGRHRDCIVSSDQLIDGMGYAEHLQPIVDVRLAPTGEVWVLRGRVKDEPTMIDIYARDGESLGTLAPGSPFPAAFLPTGEVLAIGEGEFGRTLALYRIRKDGK